MEFRILGPLEVVADGRVVATGGGKQRSVLGVLLLHSNEVVSVDRLVDLVWAGQAPAAARTSVQVYVSGLRKALGEGVLLTQSPGYVLRVQPGDIDAERFEAVLRAAPSLEPAARATTLAEALALWRGPALADFTYEPFAAEAIGRLEEARLVAVEARIEADLEPRASRAPGGGVDGADRSPPAARAAASAPHARALPRRPSGRGARVVPADAPLARRHARTRTQRGTQAAGTGHPRA